MEDYNNQEDTPHHNTISHGANPAGVDDPPVTVIDSPPTASPGARPRARLSHLFGSKRIPREARAKSLTRSQKRQGPEASTHVQPPATVPNGEAHRARMIRRSASAPAVIPTRQPGPRYIGLEDRLAKIRAKSRLQDTDGPNNGNAR
ncbi:MAG: hypothetical protein L6R40_001589 [Gallowayella cf. fulva]|nr:MAG: hypothetical protein L6R40_001589 [Xanthomendoza cf. fulva]